MPMPCQLMKPLCLIVGVEKHTCLGISPMGIVMPNPEEICISLGPIYIPAGDSPSPTVSAQAGGLIKRGHDSKHFRPHFTTGTPPLPSAVPPVVDLGLIALVILLGQAKTVWGPYSIKAGFGDKKGNPAVIFVPVPGMCVGSANFTVCSEPTALPSLLTLQTPNTVFAGMSWADIAGNIGEVLAELLLSKLLDCVFSRVAKLKGVGEAIEKAEEAVEKVLRTALKPIVRAVAQKTVKRAMPQVVKLAEGRLGFEVSNGFKAKSEKLTEKFIGEKLSEKVVDTAKDQAKEKAKGALIEPGIESGTERLFGEEAKESSEGGEGAKGSEGGGAIGPERE